MAVLVPVNMTLAVEISKKKCLKFGAACRFYKLDETTGLKVYPGSPYSRNGEFFAMFSFEEQNRAWRLGFGCKTGDLVINRDFIAYTTELAITAEDKAARDGTKVSLEDSDTIYRLMRDNDFYGACDMQPFNWGYLPDGKIVALDFGN